MEIKEKKYYCPKCFKQVNKQPGFDPLLSAWTCVSCGYEFKINNQENYEATEIKATSEAPVIDTDVIEYDDNTQYIEPVEEAPIQEEAVDQIVQSDEPVLTETETEPEVIEPEPIEESVEKAQTVEEYEPVQETVEKPEVIDVEPVETESVEETQAEEFVEPEEAVSEHVEEIQSQDTGNQDIDFSSTAENEEVQEKKVGFFGKLFGDDKPREKSKHVLDFLRDDDQIEEEEIVSDNDFAAENVSYEPEVNQSTAEDPFTSDTSYEPQNPDPFNMQSDQEVLEAQIQEEPKKQGFISSFLEKQEQKASEKDVERMQKDRERMEQTIDKRNYRRKKRRQWAIAHWSWILCGIVAFILVCYGGYKFYEYRKLTVVGIDSQECVEKNYVDVVDEFADHGFTNVKAVPVEDLDLDELDREGEIIAVSIDENLVFNSDSKFAYDAPVIIQYHSASKVIVPMSSSEARSLSYTEVVAKFKEAGFENIDTNKQEDLIVGWLRSDGQVAHITIAGNENFKQGDSFRVDSKVIVTYHTFKQNDSKKEEEKKEDKKEETTTNSKKEDSKKEESTSTDKKEESTTESKKEESEKESSKKEESSDSKTNKK